MEFGDLDWPLNASRRFVSISWASCCTRFDKNHCHLRAAKFREVLRHTSLCGCYQLSLAIAPSQPCGQ